MIKPKKLPANHVAFCHSGNRVPSHDRLIRAQSHTLAHSVTKVQQGGGHAA